MALPQAVERADQRADELIAAHRQQMENGDTNPAQPPAAESQAAALPAATPEAAPPLEPMAPAPVPTNDAEYQRIAEAHRVLQGKYSAEVPRMAEELRALRDQTATLTSQLEDMKTSQQAAPAIPAPDDKVLEDYDPDLKNYLVSMRQELDRTKAQNASLEQRLEAQGGNLSSMEQVTNRSLRDQFITALAQTVPTWETINVDPGFVAWLQTVNPLSNLTYQDMLNQAHADWNAQRAALIFQEWQRKQSPQSQAGTSPPITPDGGTSTPPNPAQVGEPAVWTQSMVRAFYQEMSKPKPKYPPDEAQRIERDIEAAAQAQRIRPG